MPLLGLVDFCLFYETKVENISENVIERLGVLTMKLRFLLSLQFALIRFYTVCINTLLQFAIIW